MPIYSPPSPVLSAFEPFPPFGLTQQVQGSVLFNKVFCPGILNASNMGLIMAVSNSLSAGATISITKGIYSQINNSSLSMLSSGSLSFGFNSTAGASLSASNFNGTRVYNVPLTAKLLRGEYWLGFACSVATALTSGSYSFIVNKFNASLNSLAGLGTDYPTFYGYGALASASLPNTVHSSQLVRSSNVAMRSPYVSFF